MADQLLEVGPYQPVPPANETVGKFTIKWGRPDGSEHSELVTVMEAAHATYQALLEGPLNEASVNAALLDLEHTREPI